MPDNSLPDLFQYNCHKYYRIKEEIPKRNRILIVEAVHPSMLIITFVATMTAISEGVAI